MSQRDKGEPPNASREVGELQDLRRAFELAYFIHASASTALSVTEAALSKLDHTFGKQGRRFHYVPAGRRQSEGIPSNAMRTKVSLRKEHLLQLLIYAESDSWERCNEHDNISTPLTNEDMAIRFIKHLVQITLKRNSFYVALGVGRLLYEYETSQVRQMYDILMQDHARFRDNSYLRKQKKILMREMIERFDHLIRLAKTAQKEYRFVTQPTTEPLINLVNECLRRYTPWNTACVVPTSFDPAELIPALCFSGADPDRESPVEMNRIHAILHPDCFSRLVAGLGLESPHRRLTVPQFFFSDNKEPRGDRFNPPPLTREVELRLQRTRKDRARRRKAYRVGLLRIYVDDVESALFDPVCRARTELIIPPMVNVIEVRGQDAKGELALATMLVCYEDIPVGGSLRDVLVLEDGQRLTIVLRPIRNDLGETKEVHVEIRYAETRPLRVISWMAQRAWQVLVRRARGYGEGSQESKPDYSWPIKAGLTLLLILAALITLLNLLKSKPFSVPAPQRVELPPAAVEGPSTPMSSSPVHVAPRTEKPRSSMIARATWTDNPKAEARAVRIEIRRGDVPSVDVPFTQTMLPLVFNRADAEDRTYRQYRIVLVAAEEPIWQQTIQAPRVSNSSRRDQVLNLELSPQRFPNADSYRLRVEGLTEAGWQPVGQIHLVRTVDQK